MMMCWMKPELRTERSDVNHLRGNEAAVLLGDY